MGKKNLDKLFQEKLKDFSEVPDDKVWQSIENSLDKKKKSRKVIPFWWKLGGVAAVLLIAVTLVNPFQDNAISTPVITDINVDPEKTSEENKTEPTFESQKSNESQVVETDNTASIPKDENITPEEKVAVSNTSLNKGFNATEKTIASQKEQTKNQIVAEVQVANSGNEDTQKIIEQNESSAADSEFDKINRESGIAETSTLKTEREKNMALENTVRKESEPPLHKMDSSSEKVIVQIAKEDASDVEEAPQKKSIFEEIAEQGQEEELVAENTGSKWSAGPSIAPVYYSAMGEGSPVHSIFVPNSKSGDVNLSYGLSVAYEVSKKLSIRSGVHKVDYGYRTNDVEFSSSLENASSGQIDNIDYSLTARSLVVSSKASASVAGFDENPSVNNVSSDVSATSAARDGIMEQQFGYLEVPVELNYAVLDKRFGINLIGGVSSLFLVDNSISLSSGDLTTEMGEANNVNSVNFSTNVGFGLNYKVTSKVQLNIEPVFKYQLNTFSETDGTFNPFSVGVYSGLSFKF